MSAPSPDNTALAPGARTGLNAMGPNAALVMMTGDLAALVACRRETISRDRARARTDGGQQGPAGSGGRVIAWIPGSVTGHRRAAALSAAEWCGVDSTISEPETQGSAMGLRERSPSHIDTAALLQACAIVLEHSLGGRVVSPVHVGLTDPDGSIREPWNSPGELPTGSSRGGLDSVAAELDRAALVWQLAMLEAEGLKHRTTSPRTPKAAAKATGGSGRIDLPCVDLTDRQLVELALDFGVPLSALNSSFRPHATTTRRSGQALAWACATIGASSPCGICVPCRRWAAAFDESTGAAPEVVVRDTAAALKPKSK